MDYNKNKIKTKYKGFSLLELLITLCILSILSFASIYYYQQNNHKTQLALYLNQFYSDLTYAKEQALTKKHPVHICPIHHQWENGYQLFVKAEHPNAHSRIPILLTRTPPYPNSLHIQAHFGLNQACVYFNAAGESLFNGHIIYVLENTKIYGKIILTQTGKMHLEIG